MGCTIGVLVWVAWLCPDAESRRQHKTTGNSLLRILSIPLAETTLQEYYSTGKLGNRGEALLFFVWRSSLSPESLGQHAGRVVMDFHLDATLLLSPSCT